MPPDLLAEGPLLPLNRAARLPMFRVEGKPPHINTLRRWTLRGVGGVRLEVVKRGRIPLTTEAACRRFMVGIAERNTAAGASTQPKQSARPLSAAAKKRLRVASAELDAAGI